jgi:hypothetical protein
MGSTRGDAIRGAFVDPSLRSEFVKKSRVLWKTWIAFTIGS